MDINFAERVRIKKRIQKANRRIERSGGRHPDHDTHEKEVIARLIQRLDELEALTSPMNSGESTPPVTAPE